MALTVTVAIDAVEALGGDGSDVTAFEDTSRSTHAVTLSYPASTRRRSRPHLGTVGSDGKRKCMGTTTDIGFAESPMHRLTCAPGYAELVCNRIPEFGLESAKKISCLVHMVAGVANFVFPIVEFGEKKRIIPIVNSRKLVALLLVPVSSLLQVVLIVQPAADGAAARNLFADMVPFHTTATE